MKDQEYNFVKYKIRQLFNIDLDDYKSTQMQRRLNTYLLRSGHPNWPTLFRAIQDDAAALSKFKDYLTINVSTFFRDIEKFDYLTKNILPELLRTRNRLRVWSAGCSLGHEPYSLAVLLAEASGIYANHYILATDLDNSALTAAQAGGPYAAEKIANASESIQRRYFRSTPQGYYVIDAIRRKVTFQYQNLLEDPFENDFDLILCRNVVIYFSAETKNLLYQQFFNALRPGGIFFVGSTEVLPYTAKLGFETVGISFYRRPLAAAALRI